MVWSLAAGIFQPAYNAGGSNRTTSAKARFDQAIAQYQKAALNSYREVADSLGRSTTRSAANGGRVRRRGAAGPVQLSRSRYDTGCRPPRGADRGPVAVPAGAAAGPDTGRQLRAVAPAVPLARGAGSLSRRRRPHRPTVSSIVGGRPVRAPRVPGARRSWQQARRCPRRAPSEPTLAASRRWALLSSGLNT